MAKFKITAPESDYTGAISGVEFRDGAAVVDDAVPVHAAVLNYCRSAGYRVEDAKAASDESGQDKTPPDGNGAGEDDGSVESFDPSANGVPAVLAYLDAASYEEAVRVLDTEAEGKNRKGITDQRDAILDSKKEESK